MLLEKIDKNIMTIWICLFGVYRYKISFCDMYGVIECIQRKDGVLESHRTIIMKNEKLLYIAIQAYHKLIEKTEKDFKE